MESNGEASQDSGEDSGSEATSSHDVVEESGSEDSDDEYGVASSEGIAYDAIVAKANDWPPDNPELELWLPPEPHLLMTETVIERVADFLENEMKRQVTCLKYRESMAANHLQFGAVQRIMVPSSLKELTLNGRMGNATAANLVSDILGNKFVHLKEIRLFNSQITDGSIVKELLQNHPQLQILEFGANDGSLDATSTGSIAEGLASGVRVNLKKLDVGRLYMEDDGLLALSSGLLQCASLDYLSLQANYLTKCSIPLLTTLLNELPLLTKFRVNSNPALFRDAPMEDVHQLAVAASSTLKEFSIQVTGLSAPGLSCLLRELCKSKSLSTLFTNYMAKDVQAWAECLPKFESLRTLHYMGEMSPQLTKAVQSNISLYNVVCVGGPRYSENISGRLLQHFQRNRIITKAKSLLQEEEGSDKNTPLGQWPLALAALGRTAPGATAVFLVLRSKLFELVSHSTKETTQESAKSEGDGNKPSKRQRLALQE